MLQNNAYSGQQFKLEGSKLGASVGIAFNDKNQQK